MFTKNDTQEIEANENIVQKVFAGAHRSVLRYSNAFGTKINGVKISLAPNRKYQLMKTLRKHPGGPDTDNIAGSKVGYNCTNAWQYSIRGIILKLMQVAAAIYMLTKSHVIIDAAKAGTSGNLTRVLIYVLIMFMITYVPAAVIASGPKFANSRSSMPFARVRAMIGFRHDRTRALHDPKIALAPREKESVAVGQTVRRDRWGFAIERSNKYEEKVTGAENERISNARRLIEQYPAHAKDAIAPVPYLDKIGDLSFNVKLKLTMENITGLGMGPIENTPVHYAVIEKLSLVNKAIRFAVIGADLGTTGVEGVPFGTKIIDIAMYRKPTSKRGYIDLAIEVSTLEKTTPAQLKAIKAAVAQMIATKFEELSNTSNTRTMHIGVDVADAMEWADCTAERYAVVYQLSIGAPMPNGPVTLSIAL